MTKKNADRIEKEALTTRDNYHGQRGNSAARPLTVREIRSYVDRVLFLCKELKKAKAKNETGMRPIKLDRTQPKC